MVSRCCRAEISLASANYVAQLYDDWYECECCGKPCLPTQIKDETHE